MIRREMASAINTALKLGIASTLKLDKLFHGHALGDASWRGDRYAEYHRLLANGPITRSFTIGGWAALGFDAVQEGLRDDRFSADMRRSNALRRFYGLTASGGESFIDTPTLLNTDPPDHTRLRKLARQGFLHRYVATLDATIETIVTSCLSRLDNVEEFELVEALARPLPVTLISEVLGVESAQRDEFRAMSEEFLKHIGMIDIEALQAVNNSFRDMSAFMNRVLERKRQDPGADLLSAMLDAEGDDKMTTKELVILGATLMTAGYETTMRLIASAMWLLVTHPEQLREVRADPSLIANAVEEALRLEPPAQAVIRVAKDDFEFHGAKLKAGQTIAFIIAAANRDPDANPDPHSFDVKRENRRHVAFGYGPHLCLGAELARLEARIALLLLLDRFEDLQLVEAVWEPNLSVRGLERLRLACH